MRILLLLLSMALAAFASDSPQFTEKGELRFPANYREWVFLSSGLGMTYGPNAAMALDNPMFDNVYVNPSAYASFKETGKWPEGTTFVLEIRYSTSQGSINKGGFFQTDVAAVEAAVKDTKRFSTGWEYFNFRGGLQPLRQSTAPLGPKSTCVQCHSTNGAVESTFTQFYPAALAIAQKKGTVKTSYIPPAPSPSALLHSIQEKKAPATQMLAEMKSANPTSPVLREMTLNRMGYGLLESGDRKEAIEVFRWAASTYPNSANAQDSLAEAYEADKQPAAAREAAQRALSLLSADTAMSADNRDRLRKAIEERIARLK
jgi:tetratricopeptide (TPR) repeat protein